MRIGISAYLLHEGRDYRSAGLSTYIHQLLIHLPQVSTGKEVVVFHGRDAPRLSGVRSVVSPVPTDRPPVRIVWEQTGLPLQAASHRVDVLHGTANVLPRFGSWPTVLTVHDLSFLRHPDRFPRGRVKYLRLAVSQSVGRATRIIAVSANTRADLVELLEVSPDRVSVVYSGVDSSFRPLPRDVVERFRQEKFGGRPYVLNVGTLEPRKNLDVLIRAYARLRPRVPHALALVGARGWMYENLFQLVGELRLKDHVKFVDYAPPSELPLWYNCADLLAYPSAYEGFGLPVLEAMACGLPTVTTASSSLEELAGKAGVTVEPGSEEALEVAMARVLEDPQLRADLARLGRERAAAFSWEETARRTLQIYEEAVEDVRS